jgi:LysM repeat protein
MTRKQIAFVIAVNAVISALISVGVVLLVVQPERILPITMPSAATATVQPVAQPVVQVTTTAEEVIHVVVAGDTISGLALQYDVPAEDIIAANQLDNPNYLQVGAQLIIPVGGLPEATATFTPAPTATDTPIPFEPPSAQMTATTAAELGATATSLPTPLPATGELQIEITEVLGAGDVTQERLVITNRGDQLADMQGWTLSDTEGNVYTFPNFRLWGGGNVTVYTRVGQDGSPPSNFYWGKLEPVWSVGETATLKNTANEVISTYVVGQ